MLFRSKKAIEEGILEEGRLESYRKIQKELKYAELNSKRLEKEKINDMFSGVGGIKNARNFIKSKNKRKGYK